MTKRCILLLLAVTLINNISIAQNPLTAQQQKKLDSIARQDVPPRAPGMATAIIENGKVIYQDYAGFADLDDSSKITKATRFNIASNGKQFTALAVLLLENEKKLKLEDDIRKYLPGLFTAIKQPITIRHLLTHTSGIRDVYDLWSLQGITWWKNSFNMRQALQLLQQQQDLNFEPGTSYLYSNSNYILLALIVEKASGKSFTAYTNQMFKRLNMPNTSFVDDHSKIAGPVARAYFNFDTWTTREWVWNIYGDGNIFSTLPDQVQWEKVLQGAAKVAIPAAVIRQSQQPVPGATIKNYGYGLEFGQYKGLNCVYHEGATGAWKATALRFPEKRLSFITLVNTGKAIPSMQTRQMADAFLGLKSDAAYLVTKPALIGDFVSEDSIAGTYLTPSGFSFRFEKRNGKLYLIRSGRNDIEVEREANNIFHQTNDPAFKQEFTMNPGGEMQVTAYYINHAPYTLKRTNTNWTGYDYTTIAGSYCNNETGVQIDLKYLDNKKYAVTISGQESSGLLIMPNVLMVNNYKLDLAPAGEELMLTGDRIRRVKFTRCSKQKM